METVADSDILQNRGGARKTNSKESNRVVIFFMLLFWGPEGDPDPTPGPCLFTQNECEHDAKECLHVTFP